VPDFRVAQNLNCVLDIAQRIFALAFDAKVAVEPGLFEMVSAFGTVLQEGGRVRRAHRLLGDLREVDRLSLLEAQVLVERWRDEGKISDTVFKKVARENAIRLLGLA
jgi:hypothetical protein